MQVKMSAIVVATLGISFGITASESAGSNLIVGHNVVKRNKDIAHGHPLIARHVHQLFQFGGRHFAWPEVMPGPLNCTVADFRQLPTNDFRSGVFKTFAGQKAHTFKEARHSKLR